MDYRPLGRTDIKVSALCLGTMTWGSQNTEAEGHAQIDMALDHGINFIDTAEMYPVTPHSKETSGDSERILGTWLENSGRREDVIVATKLIGEGYQDIRDGGPMDAAFIRAGCEDSLKKLRTDYIDLYQIHWPNRGSYHFRQHWKYDPSTQDTARALDEIELTLATLDALVKEGKIRTIGLSNESCWGTMRFLSIAEKNGFPRVVSMQNEYSFLRRFYDLDMAEMSHHEDVGLLAYTPLGGGLLTGKYSGGQIPEGSRATVMEGVGQRMTEPALAASDAYVALAKQHGLDPSQMALAWCAERPFMNSVIFGATTQAQLENSLKAADLSLTEEVNDGIFEIYKQYSRPF